MKSKANWKTLPFSTTRGSPQWHGPLFSPEPICSSTSTLMWTAAEPVKFSIRLAASHASGSASAQQIHSQPCFHCWRKLNVIPYRCKRRCSCIKQYPHLFISLIHIKTKRERRVPPAATAYVSRYRYRRTWRIVIYNFPYNILFSHCLYNSTALCTVYF